MVEDRGPGMPQFMGFAELDMTTTKQQQLLQMLAYANNKRLTTKLKAGKQKEEKGQGKCSRRIREEVYSSRYVYNKPESPIHN